MHGVVPIVSCYEAGRDGFWLHRYLVHCGVANVVVGASSIEVNRQGRRAKTDRVDVEQLLRLLIRYATRNGSGVWYTFPVSRKKMLDVAGIRATQEGAHGAP